MDNNLIGIKVYECKRTELPENLKSKTAIEKMGLYIDSKPVALLKTGNKYYDLYDLNEAKEYELKDIKFGDRNIQIDNIKEVPANLATKRKLNYKGLNPIGDIYATVKISNNVYDLYEVDKVEVISTPKHSTKKTIESKINKTDKYIIGYENELPIYSCKWKQLPEHLKAKKGFTKRGFEPTGNVVAYLKLSQQIYNLYDFNNKKALNNNSINKNTTNTKTTKKEKKERYKVQHFNTFTLFEDEMIKFKDDYVILDTETTGIMHDDEIIQLSVLNLNGEVLYSSYFKPQKKSHWGAFMKHKLTDEFLSDKPLWKDEWDKIANILKSKNILIHNAIFDQRLIEQTCNRYNIDINFKFDSYCTMNYCKTKYGYGKLETLLEVKKISFDSDVLHNSLVDCFMTLKVIYPDSIVFKKQIEAQKLFELACNKKIEEGDINGSNKGIKWLYDTFSIRNGNISNYISLRLCNSIIDKLKHIA